MKKLYELTKREARIILGLIKKEMERPTKDVSSPCPVKIIPGITLWKDLEWDYVSFNAKIIHGNEECGIEVTIHKHGFVRIDETPPSGGLGDYVVISTLPITDQMREWGYEFQY